MGLMSWSVGEIMLGLGQNQYHRYGYIGLLEWLLCWHLFGRTIS